MALRVKISTRAANQVRKAAEWWVANRRAAPGAIGVDFGESVALLAEQPGIGAKYEGSRTPGVRHIESGGRSSVNPDLTGLYLGLAGRITCSRTPVFRWQFVVHAHSMRLSEQFAPSGHLSFARLGHVGRAHVRT